MRKFLFGLLLVIAILVIVIWFYVLQAVPIPEKSSFSFDLEKVRILAKSQEGSRPLMLNSLLICKGAFPKLLMIAGQGFKKHPLPIYAYQIVYPDRTIIVDTAIDRETKKEKMKRVTFYQEHYAILESALREAALIALTHEHIDHCAGLAQSPYFKEIVPRIVITEEQFKSSYLESSGFTPQKKQFITPLKYKDLYLLAPGIVLIKAAGHSPGSQMMYIVLEEGTEFLLVGDIAWHMDNIALPQAHPRAVNWLLKEDVVAQGQQLRFLHDFHRNHPEVNLIVAHDGDQMDGYLKAGLIHAGFSTIS